MKISVFSLFRDSEKVLEDALSRFSRLLDIDKLDVEFFFYENDSKDDTRSIITDWFKDKPGKFFYEDVNTPKFGSVSDVYRLVLLSYYRNKLKELAGEVSSDYCLLVDSDIIYDNTHVELLIEESRNDWVMVTPNIRQYQIEDFMLGEAEDSFYDTFAMRDIYFNNVLYFTDCPLILNADRELWKDGKPVEVCSAFGGLALAKSDAYNKSRWSTSGHSEHINFCTELRRFGKICIIPNCKPKTEIDLSSINMGAVKDIAERQISTLNSLNGIYNASINGLVPRLVSE
jgi:hypothetical protein